MNAITRKFVAYAESHKLINAQFVIRKYRRLKNIAMNVGRKSEREDEMDVIWDTGELVVQHSRGDVIMSEVENETVRHGRTIQIEQDELTAFARHWLSREGYDVIKRQPEIAPCPNPECRNDKMHLEGAGDDMWCYCHKCGYAGPTANSKSEAGRLHNLIAKD